MIGPVTLQKETRLKRIAALAVASIASLFTSAALAQPLADRVPEDAVFYFGWAGSDSLGDVYGPSHLKAVVDETKARDLFGRYLNELEALVVKNEPNAKEPFRLLRTLGSPVWKHATAFFISKPDLSQPQPKFHLALLCQAGADAGKLSDEINALLAKGPKSPMPMQAVAVGDVVCFAMGYESAETAVAEASKSLSKTAAFSDALKQVSAKPVTISFINTEAIVASVEEAVSAKDADASAKVATFIDSAGLRTMKAFISTAGFDGKDWVDQTFLSVPGTKTGLFTAFPAGAIDAELLKTVPADSTFLVASRFDAAKFIRSLRDAVGKTDEKGLQYFNMGLNGLQQALGTNVLDNVLEPLGSDWAVYSSPRTGTGLLGMVAVNKLDDPERLKKALNTASVNLTNWINVGIRKGRGTQSNPPVTVHTAPTKVGDVDVTYLALPIVAPAWTIKDGKLYLGLYPQTVGAAARVAGKGGASITTSEKYQSVLKRLGNSSPESVSYFDLQTSASYGGFYPQIMLLARYAGFGDLFGLTLPEPLLPPMDTLIDHLTPAGSISWQDDAGFHKKSVTPFPGANIVSEQGAVMAGGVGFGALGTSILLPSLNRARETANRVHSASNLRQIGTGMMLYANENRGKYPPTLGELIKTEDMVPEVFHNPRGGNDEPPLPANATAEDIAKYVDEHSDYIYLGAGKNNSSPAEDILAYENPEGLEDGINILYGDGHVEFLAMPDAMREIEKAKANPPTQRNNTGGL